MRVCRIFALTALLSLVGITPGYAHDSPIERDLMVQCGAREVVLLLQHREPAGERVTLLLQAYDLDRDGQLTGLEAQRAAVKWFPHMLVGLRFEVPGESPAAREPSVKFQVDASGALIARAMIVYALPEAPAAATTRSFRVMLTEDRRTPLTRTSFQGVDGLAITSVQQRALKAPQSSVGPLPLRHGADMRVSYTLTPATP